MNKDKLTINEFTELLYQLITRNFNIEKFLKQIDYSTVKVYITDEKDMEDVVIILYAFYCWMISFSLKEKFPTYHKEIVDNLIKLIWKRGKLKDNISISNFLLVINSDFMKYNEALSNINDSVLNLSKVFLNYIFKKEITDIRSIANIGIFFHETINVYNEIFSKILIRT